jgi:hypothetical protein
MTAESLPFVPPAPMVHATDLSVWRLLWKITRSTLSIWPDHAFDKPYIRSRVLGVETIAISDPEGVRHVLTANAGNGSVTRTIARLRLTGKMTHDDLVCPPPVPSSDHPACRLALCPLHAQLSRRRGSARGARSGCLIRNGAAMGVEIRTVVRPRTSPSTPAANGAVASR